MPYQPIQNEPKYNGVYLGQLIDKPVYATQTTQAVNATGKPYKTFKKGQFIGTLWSWANVGGETSMLFYEDQYYTKPFFIKLSTKTSTPAAPEIIKTEADASKTILEKYIDKYLPWIVGGVVVAIALPTIVNTAKSSKIGAMSKGKKVVTLTGVAILLLAFKKKSKNKIILSEVQDTTDWQNTENMVIPKTVPPNKYLTVLPRYVEPILYSSYDSINGINKAPTTY